MEMLCNRCHQAVEAGASFCPSCGLPQLVYDNENEPAETGGQPARWNEAVRDASVVAWKPAMRWAVPLAVPAGIMCAFLGLPGLLLIAFAGAWAVSLYTRHQQPAWITLGAGARIGLVLGIVAGWLAFAASGGALFVERYGLHKGSQIDSDWKQYVDLEMQLSQQFSSFAGPSNTPQAEQFRKEWEALLLSPEGHAGMITSELAFTSFLLAMFAMLGGAFSARMQIRRRRPQL